MDVPMATSTSSPTVAEAVLKIVVVGMHSVGKTALMYRYTHNEFRGHYKATIGVDFFQRVLVPPGCKREYCAKFVLGGSSSRDVLEGPVPIPTALQLWDVAGQEIGSSYSSVFFREAAGCIVVVDEGNLESFQVAVKAMNLVDKVTCFVPREEGSSTRNNHDGNNNRNTTKAINHTVVAAAVEVHIPMFLCVNKHDSKRVTAAVMSETEIDKFCTENKFVAWLYTSAQEAINVREAIHNTVEKIYACPAIKTKLLDKVVVKQPLPRTARTPTPTPLCPCA